MLKRTFKIVYIRYIVNYNYFIFFIFFVFYIIYSGIMELICSSCKQPFTTSPNPRSKDANYKTCSECRSRKGNRKSKNNKPTPSTTTSEVDTNENISVFEVKLDEVNNNNITSLDEVWGASGTPIREGETLSSVNNNNITSLDSIKNELQLLVELNQKVLNKIDSENHDVHNLEMIKYELNKLIESNKKVISNFEHEKTSTRFLIEKMNGDLCKLSIKSSQGSDYEDKQRSETIIQLLTTMQHAINHKFSMVDKSLFDISNYIKHRL